MQNNYVGRIIEDFFCNGYAGRRYDLTGSTIEAQGKDWIMLRTPKDEAQVIYLSSVKETERDALIQGWLKECED